MIRIGRGVNGVGVMVAPLHSHRLISQSGSQLFTLENIKDMYSAQLGIARSKWQTKRRQKRAKKSHRMSNHIDEWKKQM